MYVKYVFFAFTIKEIFLARTKPSNSGLWSVGLAGTVIIESISESKNFHAKKWSIAGLMIIFG